MTKTPRVFRVLAFVFSLLVTPLSFSLALSNPAPSFCPHLQDRMVFAKVLAKEIYHGQKICWVGIQEVNLDPSVPFPLSIRPMDCNARWAYVHSGDLLYGKLLSREYFITHEPYCEEEFVPMNLDWDIAE